MARLRRVDCSEPGIRRRRRGRGFQYIGVNGETIADAETRDRIRALAVPPAWEEVWICVAPNGHLQATGFDAAGRKQYLYHQAWRENRDREKFEEMLVFAKALPGLRRRVATDLDRRGLVRERVLACCVRLLDLGLFRIGSEEYATDNETFGLSTLRRRHISFESGAAVFDYRAKGAQRHLREIDDPAAIRVLRALARRPAKGRRLFVYREGSEWHDADADQINGFLKSVGGGDFSAKDFRTWNATVLAAVGLAARTEAGEDLSKAARSRLAKEIVADVAAYLSNTPAVCRASYIDPRVFDLFDSGATLGPSLRRAAGTGGPDQFADREKIERAVRRLLS